MTEPKEIYLSHVLAGWIAVAIDYPQEYPAEKLAADHFNGDAQAAEDLVKFFTDEQARQLLNEIIYWDTPAEDCLKMTRTYNNNLDGLNKLAEEKGILLRWERYNDNTGKPVPEEDRHPLDHYYEYARGNDQREFFANIAFYEKQLKDNLTALYEKTAGASGIMAEAPEYIGDALAEIERDEYATADGAQPVRLSITAAAGAIDNALTELKATSLAINDALAVLDIIIMPGATRKRQ